MLDASPGVRGSLPSVPCLVSCRFFSFVVRASLCYIHSVSGRGRGLRRGGKVRRGDGDDEDEGTAFFSVFFRG